MTFWEALVVWVLAYLAVAFGFVVLLTRWGDRRDRRTRWNRESE